MEVWVGSGTPTASGRVKATLDPRPKNAVIAVSRYTKALEVVNNLRAAKANGPERECPKSSNRNVDTEVYSVELLPTFANSVAYGAVAIRLRDHTPGRGFTERAVVQRGSDGDTAGLAIVDKPISSPGPVTVTGTVDSPTDWAVIAVEIKPAGLAPGP